IVPAAKTAVAPLDEEERLDLEEDRAGIVRWRQGPPPRPRPKTEPVAKAAEPVGPGVVIFPASVLDAHATAEGKRDVKTALGAALDKPLALTPVPADWNAWEAARLATSPWAGDAFRAIREGQAGRTHVGRDVVCFVGPAGAGKSTLGRDVAESLGVPFARYQADSSAENSFSGTNARWTTKHLSFVEQAMARHRHASPMVMVEELCKASGTRRSNGGTLHDCLHGMWEPETARAWHSVFLLHPVSLEHVPFIATANSLDGLPSSLLDRMRIVRVPEPGPEHLGVLAPRLARAVCRDTGQDERFGELDGDELSALADAWRGGSIRRLRRLVEVCLRSRESGPAAMPRH
ncbi:AAA family ATPase, partial [Methylobacterium sp. EM32]|uniref:AAA family ATPase n=1 Tax=Methylobacterium sp. EM32 TaxID=3163481 RepID=UPI0033BDEF10